ncbi:hypothetical protein ACFXKW_26620 [Streptomyces sp. NPDC059193]|uniref:hypothetical protein n=1 Tax=Streptomyces sp. NPDC059193 TaxID=3346763 RepID=UPI003683C21D
MTVEEIATRYTVATTQVYNWTSMPGFPEGWTVGMVGDTLVRNADDVDAWLKANFPVHWAKGQDSDNPFGLPKGGDRDLVSLAEICRFEATALGRTEPVPTPTLRGYLSKGKMPQPDRLPGDGQRPEVPDRRWFRKTAYDWVNRPRQRMRRQTKAEEPEAKQNPVAQQSAVPVVSAVQQGGTLTLPGISSKYGVIGRTAGSWTQAAGFPEAAVDPAGYDAAAVDEWVRVNRPRAWATSRRRPVAEAAAPAVEAKTPAKTGPATTRPASDKGRSRSRSPVELEVEGIVQRFGVPRGTAANWITVTEKRDGDTMVRPGFPEPRRRRPRAWDQDEVDAWVEKARPHVWAAFTGSGPVLVNPLPEGDPDDLLDIDDFGKVLGNATRGEPVLRDTMAAYHNRGQIPYADRAPEDGGIPRVFSYHWYRRTVNAFVLSRPGPGNFEPK